MERYRVMISRLFSLIKDLFIHELSPVTLGEFIDWINDVIALTRLPNNDSMQFALSTIVLESKKKLTKRQAASLLEKGALNQFASFMFQDLKSKRIIKEQEHQESLKPVTPATAPQDPEFGDVDRGHSHV